MPIKPENKAKYPVNWSSVIVPMIRARSGGRCEFTMTNGARCEARQYLPHPITRSKVVLTVAHLNHDPADCRPENLLDSCQRCHNRYDNAHRKKNAAATRRSRMGMDDLFPAPPKEEPVLNTVIAAVLTDETKTPEQRLRKRNRIRANNKAPLSQIMNDALAVAMAHGARLMRLPGGFWVQPGFKWVSGSVPSPSIGTSTIEALVARGLMEYSKWQEGRKGRFPVEVRVKQ